MKFLDQCKIWLQAGDGGLQVTFVPLDPPKLIKEISTDRLLSLS